MVKTEQKRCYQGLEKLWTHVVDAQSPIMLILINCVSKNDSFLSKRNLAMWKNTKFLLLFHSYPLSEADLAGKTGIFWNIMVGHY